MDISALNKAVFQTHDQGRKRGHYFAYFEGEELRGRRMRIGGRDVTTFASCSYLGLEFEPELVDSAQEAYRRYGTQTSFSRGYLSSPFYRELEEELLPQLFGAEGILVTTSTSAAHMIAIPALVDERDAVVCDHQVHRSVDDALTLQCARSGATKVVIKHGKLDQAFDTIRGLADRHRRVWFACDGVYSMYGDYLPTRFFEEILGLAPNVYLYVDDAHGMSWAGLHGRGHFLSRIPLSPRVVFTTSLNKAFSAGGGVLVSTDPALVEHARLVGGPYCFSGPLRPGDLGAAVASARFHLSPQLVERQGLLAERVAQANGLCRELGIPIVVENEVPFFFVALGKGEAVYLMADLLLADGHHVSVSGFPAVPSRRGGIRIALTALHSAEDVEGVFRAVAAHLPRVLGETGTSVDELEAAFRHGRPVFDHDDLEGPDWDRVRSHVEALRQSSSLSVSVADRIEEVDASGWDERLQDAGCISVAALSMLEEAFPRTAARPEQAWTLRYVTVRSAAGEVLAQAPMTRSLCKDDFVMHADVSRAIEARRHEDPYLFTSTVVSTGTMLSEGPHMHLTQGPLRREALLALVEAVFAEQEASGAQVAMFRDVPDEQEDVRQVLMEQGFFPMPMPDIFVGDCSGSEEEWLHRLGKRKYRRVVRKHIEQADLWVSKTVSGSELSHVERRWARELYLNVASKNLDLNVFPLPMSVFDGFAESSAWEWTLLYLPVEHGGPVDGKAVAVGIAGVPGQAYRPFVAGLDYRYLWPTEDSELSTYRRLLLEVTRRARELGKREIHYGMGAPLEKRRFGGRRQHVSAFVRSDDAYAASQLREFAQRHSGAADLLPRATIPSRGLGSVLAALEAQHAAELRLLRTVTELHGELRLVPLLRKVIHASLELLDAERGSLFLHDPAAGELRMWIGDEDVAEVRVPEDQGLVGAALRLGKLVNVAEAYDDPRFYSEVDRESGFLTRSVLTVPITREERTLGVLQLLNKRSGPFDTVDERRITEFAALISSSIVAAREHSEDDSAPRSPSADTLEAD